MRGAQAKVRHPVGASVTIYTDGACKGNPGPGGWGALLVSGTRRKEIFGGEPATTNNRMELTAVIRALESLKRGCDVDVYTDSQYVKNGIESWIHGWKRNGWRTARPEGGQERRAVARARRARPRATGFTGTGSRATTAIPKTIGRTR